MSNTKVFLPRVLLSILMVTAAGPALATYPQRAVEAAEASDRLVGAHQPVADRCEQIANAPRRTAEDLGQCRSRYLELAAALEGHKQVVAEALAGPGLSEDERSAMREFIGQVSAKVLQLREQADVFR